jgi:hypothetical protein
MGAVSAVSAPQNRHRTMNTKGESPFNKVLDATCGA